MVDIMFATANSKNFPTGIRVQFGLCCLGSAFLVLFRYYYGEKTQVKTNVNEIYEKSFKETIEMYNQK